MSRPFRLRRSELATPGTSEKMMTKAAQKHFVEQKYGKILNLSSVSALGNRGQANYSAAKMGVQGFTRTLGIELGPFGINANAIAPGFFSTELTAPVVDDPVRWRRMAESTFARRNGELHDLRGTAVFLASRASDYVTGQTIFVDGGFSAG